MTSISNKRKAYDEPSVDGLAGIAQAGSLAIDDTAESTSLGLCQGALRKTGRVDEDTEETVYFSHYTRPNFQLSNMSNGTFSVDGKDYVTGEHYYQWRKLSLAADYAVAESVKQDLLDAAEAVRTTKGGLKCKKVAHDHTNRLKDEGKWPDQFDAEWGPDDGQGCSKPDLEGFLKTKVMRETVHHRAFANTQTSFNLRRILLASGDRNIVHRSLVCPFFGIGQSRKGPNMLGKIYEDVRTELHQKQQFEEDEKNAQFMDVWKAQQAKRFGLGREVETIEKMTRYGREIRGTKKMR